MRVAKVSSCLLSKVTGHLLLFRLALTLHPAELLKINHYKAPRDKLICILNCCKVIFGPPAVLSVLCMSSSVYAVGLIRHLHKDESADTFVPILIYVVIKANPPHLLSNVE